MYLYRLTIRIRTKCEILVSLCFVEENIYVTLPFSFRFKTLYVAVITRQKSKVSKNISVGFLLGSPAH